MFEPEYRVGFHIITKEFGFWNTLKIVIPAFLKSLLINYGLKGNADDAERKKVKIKNHFKLLAYLYRELKSKYGVKRTNVIMHEIFMEGGQVFFRGFKPIKAESDLTDFVEIYKDFESMNILFDVVEESKKKFEIVINRCLIYESFKELGIKDLTQWMCDIAFHYFSNYHPKMKYVKDRMIARGDNICHEVFIWNE